MKRLYIAVLLLAAVVTACVLTQRHQDHQLGRMLNQLDHIERTAQAGDMAHAVKLAKDFADEYQRVSDRMSCYVAHDELRNSWETASLLPSLLQQNNEEELWMELNRLRSQLIYLQQVDDPLLHNIF